MRKTNLIKGISIVLISVMVIAFSSSVFAADNTGFNDLTSTLSNSSNSNSNNSNTNTNTNTNTNSNTNRNTNTNTNTKTNSNTNNSSIYNNTNLPKTGIESSVPVAALVVIFGVSAVYAYRKIKEYKDI